MDEKTARYFRGDINAAIMPVIFGRERLGLGRDHITVTDPDTDIVLYNFFDSYRPHRPKITGDKPETKPKLKSSGNQLTYAKLYISELYKYPNDILSYEYAGMCMHLAMFIEWHDGSLVMGTGKRRRFMKLKDISRALRVSTRTTQRLMDKLKELKLIVKVGDSYKVTGKLFGKGRSIPCESNLKKE